MRLYSMLPTAAAMFAAAAVVGSASASAATETRISGPHIHDNLAVYFVHGRSADGPTPLTLAEALAKGSVNVIETGSVNELKIENTGTDEVFIQSGDIVKGGKQDRVLTVSLLLPAKSGKVPIASFCVEQGRWTSRGKEDVGKFSSAVELDAFPHGQACYEGAVTANGRGSGSDRICIDRHDKHSRPTSTSAAHCRLWRKRFVDAAKEGMGRGRQRTGGAFGASRRHCCSAAVGDQPATRARKR